jgi:hypothetical protein
MRLSAAVVLVSIMLAVLTQAGSASAEAPPEKRGFQLAFRPSIAVPFGKAARDVKMSDLTSLQYVPVLVDVGGKPIPQLFLGGYVGLGFGSTAGELDRACQSNGGSSCGTFSFRLGFEVLWSFLPRARLNPWIGYGIGYDSLAFGKSQNDVVSAASLTGIDFAHFLAGVDVRVSRAFGLGPYIDYSLGQYSSSAASIVNNTTGTTGTFTSEVRGKTIHQWFAVGLRFVLFP